MSKTSKTYDLDPDVIAATLVELPEDFALTDVSRHPRMLAAHRHMIADIYDRLVATFLSAYARELGVTLVSGTPFKGESRWRKVGESKAPAPGALRRLQQRPLATGVRVYCPPAGLTGRIIGTNNGRYCVQYDLGTVRWETEADLRAALPGQTTGTKGLPPDDPLFAEQQEQLTASRAYLASRHARPDS